MSSHGCVTSTTPGIMKVLVFQCRCWYTSEVLRVISTCNNLAHILEFYFLSITTMQIPTMQLRQCNYDNADTSRYHVNYDNADTICDNADTDAIRLEIKLHIRGLIKSACRS